VITNPAINAGFFVDQCAGDAMSFLKFSMLKNVRKISDAAMNFFFTVSRLSKKIVSDSTPCGKAL
jgi:hypothetical protein